MDEKIDRMVLTLNEIGAILTGNFTLKSGIQSPVYVDMRRLTAYPKLLKAMAELLIERVKSLEFTQMCGVPYGALAVATLMSVTCDVPLCIRRKEKKTYGTAKLIEGVYKEGERVLIIEDVVTSGKSISETAMDLRTVGLVVGDCVCFIDRREGSVALLQQQQIKLHALITLKELLLCLQRHQKAAPEALQWLHAHP